MKNPKTLAAGSFAALSVLGASFFLAPLAFAQTVSAGAASTAAFGALANIPQVHAGQTNNVIMQLQRALIASGYLASNVTPTGYYGALTQAAVARLQASLGIQSDGSAVGPKTLAKFSDLAHAQASSSSSYIAPPAPVATPPSSPSVPQPQGTVPPPWTPVWYTPPAPVPVVGNTLWYVVNPSGVLVQSNIAPQAVEGQIISVSGSTFVMRGVGVNGSASSGAVADKYLSLYTVNAAGAVIADAGPLGNLFPAIITVADVAVGDDISVQGNMTPATVLATHILDSSLDGRLHWAGTVSAVNGTTITLTTYNGTTLVPLTVITASASISGSATSISVGDIIEIYGPASGTTITARTIFDEGKTPLGGRG